jgi:hypothetical protein
MLGALAIQQNRRFQQYDSSVTKRNAEAGPSYLGLHILFNEPLLAYLQRRCYRR